MEEKIDLRIQRTHKALCDTFFIMLHETTFEKITVNSLCTKANIRRATFYKHFADKYDFFGFFIRNILGNFLTHIHDYEKSGTPYSYYTYIFKECIYFMKENRSLIDNVAKSNMFSTLLDIFADEIYKDVYANVEEHPEGVDKLHIPHDILAAFYTGGIIQSIRLWFTNHEMASAEEFIQGITTLIESVQPKK